ncbi:zincin-like metallopeptidase domain-containing protein [Nitrosomonas supralitoralis]|uniref:DNA primase n=1 Tax=Nitrosomonas supralitoralis TaxID=2116706 RepID=A0A2P7NSP6_9PROT|nr:zincin-like metallopeptidase domain-containing protein [Nitrosomonas supralitoralis]PSJ16486.1 DNA primase [Nitrosomonas supralitoralis]
MKPIKKAFHEQVAENLIEQLKQGTAPWQKPWKPGDPLLTLPHNPTTGKRYRGINTLKLMSRPYSDPRWLTFKQAVSIGAQVRKGEHGTQVQYWKFTEDRTQKDDSGNSVLDSDGQQIKEQVKLERPRAFYATVFNGDQIDNLPQLEIKTPDWNPIDRAEEILQASHAVIKHGESDRAFYRPTTDSIHLPHKHQFPTPDRYYATALHELGHWSGSETRLNRDLSHPFGSEGYAKEELRAEIASMILGSELGIGHDPRQHVSYVGSWIKVLEQDPKEIFRAAADAEKIQDYVLSLSQTQDVVQEQDNLNQLLMQNTAATATLSPDLVTVAQTLIINTEQNLQSKANEMDKDPSSELESKLSHQETHEKHGIVTRRYLVVPFKEKDQAKAAGANWDNTAKSWYVGKNADIRTLQRWLPENVSAHQEPALNPEAEFAEVLRSHGCIVEGNHPVMDGTKQRIKVELDKPGEKSGFYVAHLDGYPAGYVINNRTKSETHWKAKGYSLTDEQKAALAAQAAIKQQNRRIEQHEQQLKVAAAIKELLLIAPIADPDHPYLSDKNARPGDLKMVPENADAWPTDSIIKIAKDWKEAKALREENPSNIVLTAGDLLLSAQDINGDVWSVQTIQPSGAKFFVTGSKKESNFHVVDAENRGLTALDAAPAIVISEGYATADTLSQALDAPVVAAFDSGNLSKVAQVLHEKYPHKPIVIAGDDDFLQESVNGINPGREKAIEAAKLVNGGAVFPTFAPGEQMSLRLSDFNDLANKSTLGIEAVKRQVGSVVRKASEHARDQAKDEKLQDTLKPNKQERAQKQVVTR